MRKASRGYNQANMQDMNRTLILQILQKEKNCARTRLSEVSGLKQATVTHIINDFIAWGLVREVGFLTGSKGRRSIAIEIDKECHLVAGIRFGIRTYSVGIFNLMGENVFLKKGLIPGIEQLPAMEKKLIADLEEGIKRFPGRRLLAAGIVNNRKEGDAPQESGPGGAFEEEISRRFGIPVFCEQDVNAAALAQYWYLEDKGDRGLLVYLSVGTTLRAGMVIGEDLLSRAITPGVVAELGEMVVARAGKEDIRLSAVATSETLTEQIGLATGRRVSFEEAAAMVREGDEGALLIFWDICDHLSLAIANLIHMMGPQVLIIGDEMAHILPGRMLDRIVKGVGARVLPEMMKKTKIRMSMVETDSVVYGAAIVAIREIFDSPEGYFKERQGELYDTSGNIGQS